MSAAAQTSGLNDNPTTGKDCLLAAVRWLVTVMLIRWLIVRGHALTAAIHRRSATPADAVLIRRFGTADITLILDRISRGLRRAAALEAELLAIRPTVQSAMADIARRRAIAAVIIDICGDLGIFRARPAPAMRRSTTRRARRIPSYARSIHRNAAAPAVMRAASSPRARATGPPRLNLAHAVAEIGAA